MSVFDVADKTVSVFDVAGQDWGGAGENKAKLSASKAWFLLPAGLVACGANVSLSLDAPVTTTLEQSILKSTVSTGVVGKAAQPLPQGSHRLSGSDYLFHNNITYVLRLPGQPASDILVRNDRVTGSWAQVSTAGSPTTLTRNTLTVEWDHGTAPQGLSYAYAVLPATHLDEVDTNLNQLFSSTTVLQNSASVQALLVTDGKAADAWGAADSKVLMAVREAASVIGSGWNITVPQASFWILAQNGSLFTS